MNHETYSKGFIFANFNISTQPGHTAQIHLPGPGIDGKSFSGFISFCPSFTFFAKQPAIHQIRNLLDFQLIQLL